MCSHSYTLLQNDLLIESEVLIGCFVVDDEPALGEEEAVGLCLEGRVNHFLLLLLAECRQLVHVLPLVRGLRNAEGEVEFELRQDLPAEEMLFDQSQLLQWLVPVYIRELEVQLQVAQLEECSREFVLQRSHFHSQLTILFHLTSEVILHFVLFRVYMK